MLDYDTLAGLAASPAVHATLALLFVAFLVQWYFSLPPAPKFPEAELDPDDWHGSLMRAKTKVGSTHSRQIRTGHPPMCSIQGHLLY